MCACACAGVELQRTRYVLLHIFINVFIPLSVSRDQDKTQADVARSRPNQRSLLHARIHVLSEGGRMSSKGQGPSQAPVSTDVNCFFN